MSESAPVISSALLMSLVSLAKALDKPFPPCKEAATRRTEVISGVNGSDITHEHGLMKHSPEVLKSLIRDQEMYDVALASHDQLLSENSHVMMQEPTSEKYLFNVEGIPSSTAVHARVLTVLHKFYPH